MSNCHEVVGSSSILGLCHTNKQMLCLPQSNTWTAKVADATCPRDKWKWDKIQILPHPWVVFIIQTGHQLSAAQHNRKPGTSCDPEEYFLFVFRMAGAHEGNHANISSWFALWLSGVCQHPAKWQSFHVALRATKNQYFKCVKSSMTQLCCVTLCV